MGTTELFWKLVHSTVTSLKHDKLKGSPENGSPTMKFMEGAVVSSHFKDLLQRVDGEDEEERGEWVPLPETSAMQNWGSGHPIEEDPRGSSVKQGHDPIAKSTWESMPMQEIKNVLSSHRIEGLTDVKLEEEGRHVVPMKPPGKIPHIHEIVVDASLNENTLSAGNELVHVRPKPKGKYLRDDLSNSMD